MQENTLTSCWFEARAWLEKYSPAVFEVLNSPANSHDLENLKGYFGVTGLPSDLEKMYKIINGQSVAGSSFGIFFYGFSQMVCAFLSDPFE